MRQDLQALEQRWGLALQSAGFGVWDLDVPNHRVHYSPQWKDMLGYGQVDEADSTATWRERVHPHDLPAMLAALGRHQRGETPAYDCEFRLRAASGRWHWVISRGRVVARDAQGRAERMVGTLTDVSDRREAELMRVDRDRLAAASQAKTEFLSRMSHELRTPLNAVLGFAQLLNQPALDLSAEERRQYAARIEQAGWQLLRLVNDALDLSDLDSGRMPLDLRSLALHDVLQTALQAMAGLAAERGLALAPPQVPEGACVLADAQRLQLALQRVLAHSLRHSPVGVAWQVQVDRAANGHWHIDIGYQAAAGAPDASAAAGAMPGAAPGPDEPVPASAAPYPVFEPFLPPTPAFGTTDTRNSSGLGPALAHSLLQAMGGSAQVRRVAGQAVGYRLGLPAA